MHDVEAGANIHQFSLKWIEDDDEGTRFQHGTSRALFVLAHANACVHFENVLASPTLNSPSDSIVRGYIHLFKTLLFIE